MNAKKFWIANFKIFFNKKIMNFYKLALGVARNVLFRNKKKTQASMYLDLV